MYAIERPRVGRIGTNFQNEGNWFFLGWVGNSVSALKEALLDTTMQSMTVTTSDDSNSGKRVSLAPFFIWYKKLINSIDYVRC